MARCELELHGVLCHVCSPTRELVVSEVPGCYASSRAVWQVGRIVGSNADLTPFVYIPVCVQVEAEKVAWKLAGELGLDVVTILPNFVLVSSGWTGWWLREGVGQDGGVRSLYRPHIGKLKLVLMSSIRCSCSLLRGPACETDSSGVCMSKGAGQMSNAPGTSTTSHTHDRLLGIAQVKGDVPL